MAIRFSKVLENKKQSDLGCLLALTAQPNIISFAGGLPAPATFPIKELTEIAIKVREKDGSNAMQYGPARGYMGLRQAIADRMNSLYKNHGMKTVDAKSIMITSGSQQGLDITGRAFIDKDDVVLVESPSYLGALGAFAFEQPKFVEVPTEHEGMIPSELDKILAKTENAKFIYVIPNYQNPTGITWSLERRKAFMEVVNKYQIPVFEDNPYGDLRFEGEEIPPLKAFDTEDLVIYSGTFSKVLAPGMRIAWILASETIMKKFDEIKESTDLCTSCVGQREVAMYMNEYDFEGHIRENCKLYEHRRNVMWEAIQKYFPSDVKCQCPHGGLFLWVELPEHMNARKLFEVCIENEVAFVPGDAFFPASAKNNFFRLNFSYNDDELIIEGIKRIAKAMKEYK